MTIRVLLADDHRMFREGLRRILEEEGNVEVVGEAANGIEAVQLARQTVPDVVVMDIGMALANGIEATRQIVHDDLGRVVVLSIYDDDETVIQAFRAGATGYVPKKSAGRELLNAIEAVHRGDLFISPNLPARLRSSLLAGRPARRGSGRLDTLSNRQRQVLQLLAEGHTNKQMAAILGIAVETVKSHRKSLKRTLGLKTVAEMTRFALENGLVRRPARTVSADPPENASAPEPKTNFTGPPDTSADDIPPPPGPRV